MRRLFLTLLLIVCVAFYAEAGVIIGNWYSGAACSTPDNGDELDEGFLGAGYENSWSEDNGTPNEDASLTNSPPTNSCSEGLRINVTQTVTSTSWNKGSTHNRSTNLDVVAEFQVDSITMDNYSSSGIILWDTDNNPTDTDDIGKVEFRQGNGGADLYIRAVGSSYSNAISISLDTWYRLWLHLDGTAASSYIDVDSWNGSGWDNVGQETFTRRDTADGQYLILAAANLDAGEAVDFYWGYVYVNSP